MRQEKDLVDRLQLELEQERQIMIEKRNQERDDLQRMLLENERQQFKAKQQLEKERQEDKKAQEEYSKMLEKQEQDRLLEAHAREKRA